MKLTKKQESEILKRDIETIDNGRKSHREVANELYGIGYRKLAEGAVVLTKEEYENYQDLKRDVEHSFEYNQGYVDGQNKARNKTAKDILQTLYPYIGSWITFNQLKEKYGVEIDDEIQT